MVEFGSKAYYRKARKEAKKAKIRKIYELSSLYSFRKNEDELDNYNRCETCWKAYRKNQYR
jgi:hypothetical protein